VFARLNVKFEFPINESIVTLVATASPPANVAIVPSEGEGRLEGLFETVNLTFDVEAVPIPTFPALSTTNDVPVVDPIANAGAEPSAAVGLILSFAHGVDEPYPVLFVKLLIPENVFESANSVLDANDQVDVENE
jgi:hypothetical protein